MWLVNEDGFFSTVQDRKDSGWVYVRGRSETDLEEFVAVAQPAAGETSWEPEVWRNPWLITGRRIVSVICASMVVVSQIARCDLSGSKNSRWSPLR